MSTTRFALGAILMSLSSCNTPAFAGPLVLDDFMRKPAVHSSHPAQTKPPPRPAPKPGAGPSKATPPSPAQRAVVPAPARKMLAALPVPKELPVDRDVIHISTAERSLTFRRADGSTETFPVGVGRNGFEWKGTHYVIAKKAWPPWYPPAEMIKRQPYLPRMMAGGPGNPLGARALYIGTTEYRIHGTNDDASVGHAVSSGCFRMHNGDVEKLYDEVPLGTMVIVD